MSEPDLLDAMAGYRDALGNLRDKLRACVAETEPTDPKFDGLKSILEVFSEDGESVPVARSPLNSGFRSSAQTSDSAELRNSLKTAEASLETARRRGVPRHEAIQLEGRVLQARRLLKEARDKEYLKTNPRWRGGAEAWWDRRGAATAALLTVLAALASAAQVL